MGVCARRLPGILFVLLAALASHGQSNEILIDWSARTKQLVGYPSTIDYVTRVTVRVIQVNDLLYDYSGRIAAKPRTTSDPPGLDAWVSALRGQPAPQPGGPPPPCPPPLTTSLEDFKKGYDSLFPKNKDKPESILVGDTITAWQSNVAPSVKQIKSILASNPGCDQGELADKIHKFFLVVDEWERKLSSAHEFTFPAQLAPDNDYTVYISEKYTPAGKLTDVGEQSFSFSPQSDLISLSGGFLYTQLQGRTYERQAVPNQTDSELAVSGTGAIRPVFASTINVKLPYVDQIPFINDNLGFAFSIGPALQLGSGTNNVSKLGLFGGLSIVLARKFFITPGVHVGEFADFPLGFTAAGQTIPSSFTGALTPVKRNTARFAVAVTLKGFDLLKSSGGANTTTGKTIPNSPNKPTT